MEISNQTQFLKLKEEGNIAFKNGEYEQALRFYESALNFASGNNDRVTIYKNQSAVYLKLKEYEKALTASTEALEISPNDPKALYRRSEAFERLNRIEEAYKDARHVLLSEPGNKDIQPVLRRLHEKVQETMKLNSDTSVKVTKMCDVVFNPAESLEKRETAMKNILVLASEKSSSDVLYKSNIVRKITSLMKVEKDKKELYLTGIRVMCELCKHDASRAKEIIYEVGVPWIFDIMNHRDESMVNCGQHFFQTVLNTLSGLENKPESKPNQELCDQNRKEIDTILTYLVHSCNSRTICGLTRDSILQLITRNVHYTAINWAHVLVKIKGLQRIMEVASEVPEFKFESAMEVTESTRAISALCLARIYENMYYDEARKEYFDNINEFIREKLLTPEIESKVRVVVAITVLLQGPLDVGNTIISKEGILQMILVMADTDDIVQQKAACECIVAAAAKQSKVIASNGIDILKKLYKSKNDAIRIRALVGLCKVGSSGGTDASIRPFADGSNKKLAEACRKFLVYSTDKDTKYWAAEGLSYLSLDAEVKEMLIEDDAALNALIKIGKAGNTTALYGIVTTFVNLCNAYEKQEILPEMIELAKFAKRHVPEDHELDDDDFVTKRILKLGNIGITSALVALAKTESHNCKELISRVFNALCSKQELRGLIVQQGGVKCLLSLCSEGTANGIKHAAQALSRIGITMNPEVAFPGERCIEVIRPLLALLLPECPALMNFEALMALCNIACISEKMRAHIIKERGFSKIEAYLFEEHEMLRRAATQCITNLVLSPEVVELYEGKNDKFKLLFLLCGEEDIETSKAAAGAVAILTSTSKECCSRIFSIQDWIEIFKQILAHPDTDVQHRAVVIAHNVICSDKESAEKLINTEIMEILMAISIIHEEGKEKISKLADTCLKTAEKLNIIKKNDLPDVIT